jgi:hypothetical protein
MSIEDNPLDGLHPSDRDSLLIPLVAHLMVSLRASYPAVGVEEVVDRLLSIADTWYGVTPLMAAARAAIVGEPLPQPPSYADGLRRAPAGAGGLSQ